MIIQIRGTSGSGKSTLVRNLIAAADHKIKFKEEGRKQPIGYLLGFDNSDVSLQITVPGHYETACGGCDTIPSMDRVFELVTTGTIMTNVSHCVFEGLLASEEVRRTVELHKAFPGQLRVIHLTTPVEECLASIRARREARGDTRPLKEDNTRNRVKVIDRACARLREAGVAVISADRDDAAAHLMTWLV